MPQCGVINVLKFMTEISIVSVLCSSKDKNENYTRWKEKFSRVFIYEYI
jgi:hypothetical protein